MMNGGSLRICLGILTCTMLVNGPVSAALLPESPAPPAKHQISTVMIGMPLQFEANEGQVDDQVKFIARGKGYTLFLTPTESVMVLSQQNTNAPIYDQFGEFMMALTFAPSQQDTNIQVGNWSSAGPLLNTRPTPIKHSVVRMKLEGANPLPAIDGMEKLPGIVNYFIGNDPAKWRTKIPTYAKVHYKDTYPGIDLAYYGTQGKLEYDFIVAPGADPSQIKLAFEGASEINVAESGDLLLTTTLGEVRVQKPIVYQLEPNGHKTLVAGNYITSSASLSAVKINLAAYDTAKPLIIDPVIVYSSFIGGAGQDNATDITIDSSGNAWVVGWGTSLSIMPAGAAYDNSFNGGNDIFIMKLNPAGVVLVRTYLGGASNDHTPAITLDGSGNVWVTGTTGGSTFPITSGAIQPIYAGVGDAFVSKLDSNASSLLYSTFYGGTGGEGGASIAVDPGGSVVHIAGTTSSLNLPGVTSNSIQPTYGGGVTDGFVARLNILSGQTEYATYLGGSDRDELRKVRVNSAGEAHVAGRSFSTNFPGTVSSSVSAIASFQSTYGGAIDAVVAKLNSAGTQLIYSSYLGGASDDSALGLALDSGGNAVVSGVTGSSTFPLAGTPFQSTRVAHDYFVTKLNSSGTALILSTFFGGVGDDFGAVVALDQFDNIYLTGPINSCRIPNFSHPLQIDRCSLGAPFLHVPVAKLDAGGSSLLGLVVFTGSTGVSAGLGIATDLQGNAYVAGLTRASDFTTQNPFQSTYGGGPEDGFVARISFRPLANSGPDQSKPEGTLVTLDGTGSTGASLTYIWTQVAGPTAALTGATTGSPTFIAPHVSAAGGTTTFELVVCEGTSSNCSDPDAVNVHITNVNHPPVAEAGPDQTVQEGSPVILDGSASYDPDVEPLTYTWLQIFGPPVTLAYPHSATPSFTAPPVGASGG